MDLEALLRGIPVGTHALHPNVALNFQMNRFLAGGGQLEEVRALRITTLEDWKREYMMLARTAESQGRTEAAAYYRAAEFFIPHSDPDKAIAYGKFRALLEPRIAATGAQRRDVPFGSGALPCIEYAHPAPRETIVMHGGFDSFQEDMFRSAQVLQAAGYRVITFEGPGQGAALTKYGLTLTPDWHEPTAAVLDAYGITSCSLLGMSLGGCLALRAAAREPRIQRVIVWGVLREFLPCFIQAGGSLGGLLRLGLDAHADALIDLGAKKRMREDMLAAWGIPHGMHLLGKDRPAAFLREVTRYTTVDVSPRVKQDVLLFGGAEDHYVPPRQLFEQAEALTAARSLTMRLLTRAEHAADHCTPGNYGLVLRTILHWLDERLA